MRFFSGLTLDLKAAFRSLLKQRGTSLAALAILALGLGANVAIFSVADAVMFRPLPFPEPDRIAMIWELHAPKASDRDPEYRDSLRHWPTYDETFAEWKQQSRTLEHLSGWQAEAMTLTGQGNAQRLTGAAVSQDFFKLLGAVPQLGRTFTSEEEQIGANGVVLLSDGLWRSQFGRDRSIVGKTIQLDGTPHTVAGVLRPGFNPELRGLAAKTEFYVPLLHGLSPGPKRSSVITYAAGRIQPGYSREQAQAEMNAIIHAQHARDPRRYRAIKSDLVPLQKDLAEQARPAMLVLLGAAACILLICCANLANLALSRVAAHQRELSMLMALGAQPAQLVRRTLVESLLLSLAGGMAGLALAYWFVDLLLVLVPEDSLPMVTSIAINARAASVGVGLTLLSAVGFGCIPSVASVRLAVRGLVHGLRQGGGAGVSRAQRSMRSALIVSQIALALVLVTAAGLLLRGFVELRSIDPGFHAGDITVAEFPIPMDKHKDTATRAALAEQVMEQTRQIRGVSKVVAATAVPFGWSWTSVRGTIPGRPGQLEALSVGVSSDYFQTIGIPVKAGRVFTSADQERPTMLVNTAFVKTYWPEWVPDWQHALGQAVQIEGKAMEIVGIVGDVKSFELAKPNEPTVYVPMSRGNIGWFVLFVQTSAPLREIAPAMQAALRTVDPDQALTRFRTLDQSLQREYASPTFHLTVVGFFAIAALTLAAMGIYAVMSYSVLQRTREIGIRVAVGAPPVRVFGSVMKEALMLTSCGVAAGVVLSVLASQALTRLLFGVKPVDPLTFVLTAFLLSIAGVMAAWVPARRALAVDALRSE